MQWIDLLLMLFSLRQIQCGIKQYKVAWELFQAELLDSSTFSNWVCDGVVGSNLALTCNEQTDLTTKLLQGGLQLTRSISMPTSKAFCQIRISFDIYYLNQWTAGESVAVTANTLLVYNYKQSPTTDVDDPTRYCIQAPLGQSYNEVFEHIDSIIQFNDPILDLQILHQRLTGTTSEYGIRNLVIYLNYCDEFCEECNENVCLTCKQGYQTNADNLSQCRCPQNIFSLFNPTLTCVSQCPTGYQPDENIICQLATTNQIFTDLTSTSFTTYYFQYFPDTYYSTYSNMIQTIDSKNVAGFFSNNDYIQYSNFILTANQKCEIKFNLYIFNEYADVNYQENLVIKLNGFETFQLNFFYGLLMLEFNTIKKSGALDTNKCIVSGYKYCVVYTIGLYFEITEDITNIEFVGKFSTQKGQRKWAIRDFEVNQYQILSSQITCINNCATCSNEKLDYCLSCSASQFLFQGKCLSTCPSYTTINGNICQDILITASTTSSYVYTLFQDINIPDYEIKKQQNQFTIYNNIYEYHSFQQQYYMNNMIFGGYQIWNNQQIIFEQNNLTPFYKVQILFNLIFIDSVNSVVTMRVSANNEESQYFYYGSGTALSDQIGLSFTDVMQTVSYTKTFDSTKTLTIQLQCIQNNDDYAYCAIYNFRAIITKCDDFCLECDSTGTCITAINTESTDSNGCKSGYYLSQVKDKICEKCSVGCDSCTTGTICNTCSSGYEMHNGFCFCSILKAQSSYCEQTNCSSTCKTCSKQDSNSIRFNPIIKECLSCDQSLHLWLNVSECRCLDGYYMENSICYPCYPTCSKCYKKARQCTACVSGYNRSLNGQQCDCSSGYFQEDNSLECSPCDSLCEKCSFVKTQCRSCYSTQFRKLYNNTCICDDGYYDNGSLICSSCPQTCQTCSDSTTCLSCYAYQNRRMSNDNKSCICNSGYFEVSGSNTCDQCNYTCSECTQSNASTNCTRCPSTREPATGTTIFSCICQVGYYDNGSDQNCLDCADYLNPPTTHYCYSNCGDGIVQWNEECDDGNNDQRDGCYKCLYANSFCLDATCTTCRAGKCTGCIDGYYLTADSICMPCDQSCLTCVDRSDKCLTCSILQSDGSGCLMCQTSQGFQIIDDQCVNICGDGIKVSGENCDDGNLKSGDGCTDTCTVESGYVCDVQCELIVYPNIKFELNQNDETYESVKSVRVKTDSLVSINGNINSIFQFKINNSNNYEISIVDLTSYSDIYTTLFLELSIQFQDQVSDPQLICSILNENAILNSQGNSFQEKNYAVDLVSYLPPSSAAETATEGLMKLSKFVLYLLLGLAILAFLFGGLDIFWNLLDALQLISYLQFLNVDFPYNVNNYFTLFGFAQFDFIKDQFDLENFISQYVNTPDADPKFRDQGYSTVFIVNIITVLTVFVTTVLTYVGCRLAFKCLTRIAQSLMYAPLSDNESVCTFFVYRITRNLQLSILKITQEFQSGIIRTFMAVAFDYNIAIFLQIQDIRIDDPILCTSFIICVLALILQCYFIYEAICFMAKPQYELNSKITENSFGSLYEGVKIEDNPFPLYFNIILLIKKMFFMMFLVMFYSAPCIQVGLVSILNLFMAAYLIRTAPMDDTNELIKQIGSELIIWASEMTVMVMAMNAKSNLLDENGLLNLGWVFIAFSTFLILFQLVLDIKQHILFLMKEYSIIRKLIDRFRLLIKGQAPEQETNIFIKKRRIVVENLTSSGNLLSKTNKFGGRQGRVVTFTLSSSSS